jgi:Leucine-rich repeat (LRR) protein
LRLARVPAGAASPAVRSPPAVAPFTDADVQRIAALPAPEQVEEVRKELMRRNPGFDGKVEHRIEGDGVTELRVVTDQVTDIAPIRVFKDLRALDCSGTHVNYEGNGQLADLAPLTGMNWAGLSDLNLNFTMVGDAGLVHLKNCTNLTGLHLYSTQVSDAGLADLKNCTNLMHLNLGGTKVSDAGLAHFKDCKKLTQLYLSGASVGDAGLGYFKECENLTVLGLGRTQVTDVGLAHFKNCNKLQDLNLLGTPVGNAGLAHFKDCTKLTRLSIGETKVTDLSLLKGIPLKELYCEFRPERDAEILRSIKTLEKINDKPAAEFWVRYDKGEFK